MGKANDRQRRREQERRGKELFHLVAEYVSKIYAKPIKEQKEIYNSFDIRWRTYCRTQKTKKIELNPDGFKNIAKNESALLPLKMKLWPKPPGRFHRFVVAMKKKLNIA